MAWLLVTFPLNLWKKSSSVTIQIKSLWQNCYIVFLTFWDFTKINLEFLWFFFCIGHHKVWTGKLGMEASLFIHQKLHFKLIDSSCSLFCATDVAKQNIIRSKRPRYSCPTIAATIALETVKCPSRENTEPKTLCFDETTHACITTDELHRKQDCHWNLL